MNKVFKELVKIKVIGVGGAGCNFLERLEQLDNKGVERIALALPGKAFNHLKIAKKIPLAESDKIVLTDASAETGTKLASDHHSEIFDAVKGADIVFIISSLSREINIGIMEEVVSVLKKEGILSFIMATKPFFFEGDNKKEIAQTAHTKLMALADAMVTIASDKLFVKGMPAEKALSVIDTTLLIYIESLIEIINKFGEINVDFNDFKTTIASSGQAFIGIGESIRPNLNKALNEASNNQFLEGNLDGAKKLLYVIYSGVDVAMDEIKEVAEFIKGKSAPDARIIFGVVLDKELKNKIKIVILAGGVDIVS